jgi:hypothetical protein
VVKDPALRHRRNPGEAIPDTGWLLYFQPPAKIQLFDNQYIEIILM